MSAPANIPPPRRRRRGSVEVYFLLYLSAIILLLGTTQGRHSSENLDDTVRELLAPGFRVEAEKPAILWRFVPAGISADSNTVLEQDSTNIITAYGTVADLRFDIVEIEDTISGRSLPAEAASLTRIGERSAVFRWQPAAGETLENRVYRVTVSATGRPIPPPDLRPETRRRVMEILDRGGTVGDSVTFTVNLLSINNRGNGPIDPTPTLHPPDMAAVPKPPDTVFVTPPAPPSQPVPMPGLRVSNLAVPPGKQWTNAIDLEGAPGGSIDWSVDAPPSVQISASSQLGIRVSGEGPASGSVQSVRVTARRKSDGATAFAMFQVSGSSVGTASFPSEMYVDQQYTLQIGGSPEDGDVVELQVMQNGARMERFAGRPTVTFTPKKTGDLVFVRTVNGQESRFTAKVQPLRPPRVQVLETRDDEVIVTTTSYGMVKGRLNHAALHILDGNANDPRLIADEQNNDEPTVRNIQRWSISPKQPGASFVFRAYALDLNGSAQGKSVILSYPR